MAIICTVQKSPSLTVAGSWLSTVVFTGRLGVSKTIRFQVRACPGSGTDVFHTTIGARPVMPRVPPGMFAMGRNRLYRIKPNLDGQAVQGSPASNLSKPQCRGAAWPSEPVALPGTAVSANAQSDLLTKWPTTWSRTPGRVPRMQRLAWHESGRRDCRAAAPCICLRCAPDQAQDLTRSGGTGARGVEPVPRRRSLQRAAADA